MRLLFYDKVIVNRMLTYEIKADEYYIGVLCVNKKYRKKGIGKNLIKNSKKIAQEKNCSRIILDVSKENNDAIKFYNEIGFKTFDEVNHRVFFSKISVLKMELDLK